MNFELIDIRRNVSALCLSSQSRLLHAKHGGRKCSDSFHFECAARLKALPGGGDLDAYPFRVKVGGQRLEDVDDPWSLSLCAIAGKSMWLTICITYCAFGRVRKLWVGLNVHVASDIWDDQ